MKHERKDEEAKVRGRITGRMRRLRRDAASKKGLIGKD
jgi:hypothetical protein